MPDFRLGDVIDDFCVKCRRLTNHSIVSLVNASAAKVRCRTCYSDHDYRNEQAPPSKKELARQKELYNAVLSGAGVPVAPLDGTGAEAVAEPALVEATVVEETTVEVTPVEVTPVEVAGVEDAVEPETKPPAKKKAARKK